MPIKGISGGLPKFPQLGELRKGAPKSGNRPGADLRWFRFTSEDAEALTTFKKWYGDEPTEVHCFLPFAEVGQNFAAWREEWGAGSLKHRCDGETCVIWQDEKTGEYHHEPKPCPGRCKQVGRLKLLIPELGRVALVTALTTSLHDIINLEQSLAGCWSLNKGTLQGLPCILSRKKAKVSVPDAHGRRTRMEKWLLFIEPDPRWSRQKFSELTARMLLPQPEPTLALPDGAGYQNGFDGEDDDEIGADPTTGEIPRPSDNHGRAPQPERAPAAPKAKAKPASGYLWPEIPHFNTKGDLFGWGLRELGVNKAGLLAAAGYANDMAIADLQVAAERMRGALGRPPTAVEPEPPDGADFSEQEDGAR